eukprot:CAMPEP_0197079108 /NCGR_PEP_ID=MMETSP1384-20130603/213460_1 /TAXON_ID=29189 /ORGANISM="Ammonia sp." /LENGTH=557 /DNA_ID=CAMNT_0042517981 /DNA_START=13 /DNA_END=1687 /DNA_ORIENTATION=-
MGNDESSSTNGDTPADQHDFIGSLRHRFRFADKSKHTAPDERKSEHPSDSHHAWAPKPKPKPKLPTCPICFMEVSDYVRLKHCHHLICHECLRAYILTDLKHLAKYPMKCYLHPTSQCDALLDFSDVSYALDEHKDELFVFDKFSILCAIAPTERNSVPNARWSSFTNPSGNATKYSHSSGSKCEMVFFYQSKWQRDKVQPFQWIEDGQRANCHNQACGKKFFGFLVRRHHCRICGEIFCDECSSHQLPLSAASNEMLKTWLTANLNDDDSVHNVRKSNTKKKLNKAKNSLLASTASAVWESSDSDGDEAVRPQKHKHVQKKDIDDDDDDEKCTAESEKEKEEKYENKNGDAAEQQAQDEEFRLSPSEENLIEAERVRCCYACWLDYYRGVCAECEYEYCIECRQAWHDKYDCEQIKKMKIENDLRVKLNEAQTEELMLREGWRRCAGCKVWVAKSEGCNHMTHEHCPNPNDVVNRKCHFCYCCGELLYDPYRKHEKSGVLHFEDGVFSACRKDREARSERDNKHTVVRNEIQEIQSQFDENEIPIDDQNKSDCLVM